MSTEEMTETLPPPMSFGQRLVGMFTSPVRVFESLRHHPAFGGMLIFFVLVGALSYLPMHKIIQREAISNMVESVEGNENIPAERKEEILDQQRSFMEGPGFLWSALGGSLIVSPIIMFMWGFLVLILYGFGAGGDINLKHALSAVTHIGVLFLAAGIIKIPLVLMKGSAQVATSLALISPDPDPKSVLYAFLDSFDIFTIAILAVLANGMVKLARISPSKSWTMAIILFVIGMVFRVLGSMLGEMMSHMGGGH